MSEDKKNNNIISKIKSPENLHDYIKISNPGIWLLLISIVVLLTGAYIWSIFGRIETVIPSIIRVEDGKALCYIKETYGERIKTGVDVRFGSYVATITNIREKENDFYVCDLSTTTLPKENFYDGKVILDSYRPISFITN